MGFRTLGPVQRLCVAILVAACLQLLTMAAASATAGTIMEYSLPSNSTSTTTTTCVHHHCTTTTSTSTWCSCPAIITRGPDGNLWFTENGGALGYGAIGTISTTGAIKEYPLPNNNSGPVGIAAGPNANGFWFSEQNANRIGWITTAGVITEFRLPVSGSQPRGIALGADGNLWFTESRTSGVTTGYLGRITSTGTITEFAIPYAYSSPFLITSGPDGNLWFTDEGTNSVGRITIAGAVTEFLLPTIGRATRHCYRTR